MPFPSILIFPSKYNHLFNAGSCHYPSPTTSKVPLRETLQQRQKLKKKQRKIDQPLVSSWTGTAGNLFFVMSPKSFSSRPVQGSTYQLFREGYQDMLLGAHVLTKNVQTEINEIVYRELCSIFITRFFVAGLIEEWESAR